MREVLFFLMGALALGGAVGVVLARNPVHSALFLVQTLMAVAVLFLLQDADLVAAVQVIVYASAIVVLFLFVIMLIGVDRREAFEEPIKIQRPAALAIGAIIVAEIVYLSGHEWATGLQGYHGTIARVPDDKIAGAGNVERLAQVLFTDFLWPFQLTALLLVIAVVGAVVLARRSGQRAEDVIDAEPADQPSDAPSSVDAAEGAGE
jgi:NADH-quinone oxidoreductase subunit J